MNVHVCYRTVFLKLSDVDISLGDLMNSDPVGLGWGLAVCLSNKLPGNADLCITLRSKIKSGILHIIRTVPAHTQVILIK